MSATLRVSGLSRTIRSGGGELDVVDGVDLELRPGDAVGITGSLDSGWRSFLRLVVGLDPESAGSVALEGRPLDREELRQEVVFASALDPLLDRDLDAVARSLARLAASRRRRVGRASARALIAAAGVGPDSGAWSRAERLRLAVALASALSPSHLLVEVEPPLETDSDRTLLADLLRKVLAGGRGVVVGSRDELLIASVAARVLVFEDGGVLAEGAPETVLTAAWKRVRAGSAP
jgi:predicted ABC-type transport system involved in lysophospholipase L1 biosynthesis ATPase subunit